MASQQPFRLPVELWTDVFGRLARESRPSKEGHFGHKTNPMATLLGLALVCRQFGHISQPFIFSFFHFDCSYSVGTLYKSKLTGVADRAERLLAVLEQKPGYRGWIKILHCRLNRSIKFSRRYGELLPQITRVERLVERLLLQLMDLKSLILSGMHISRDLYHHICHLPTLQAVHLESVIQLASPHHPDFHPTWQELPLRELTITTGYSLDRVDTNALLLLSLGSRLTSLHASLCVLASSYQQRPPICWPFLTKLTLSVSDTDSHHLGPVLASFPSVRRLSFTTIVDDISYAPFHKECVPALTNFVGPWEIACLLIPGRPVQIADVQVDYELELPADGMEFLSQGTTQLEYLRLRNIHKLENLKLVATLLPDLRSLTLTYSYVGVESYFRLLMDFASSDCRMDQLEHLHCFTSHTNRLLPEDENTLNWLQRIAVAFRVLRVVGLQGKVWRRDWGGVGEWHPC